MPVQVHCGVVPKARPQAKDTEPARLRSMRNRRALSVLNGRLSTGLRSAYRACDAKSSLLRAAAQINFEQKTLASALHIQEAPKWIKSATCRHTSAFVSGWTTSLHTQPQRKLAPYSKYRSRFARCLVMAAEGGRTVIPEVKSQVTGNGVGVITLDRPKALNAMNLDMDKSFASLLETWAKDDSVHAVLVEGSTPRAFCSGMDIKGVAAVIKEEPQTSLVPQVFTAEYTLICQIARFAKPYIVLMDGVTMGFGIGLSGHGRYRIITERTLLAMPENGIGLFPDVGFAHLVGRSPGKGALGAYLAITGARIGTPADAFLGGLASHYVASEKLPQLREALLSSDLSGDVHAKVEGVIQKFSELPGGESKLKALLPVIETTFGGSKKVAEIVSILEKLQGSPDSSVADWATESLKGISKGAPLSLAATQHHFAEVATAANQDPPTTELAKIEGVMRREFRLALRVACRPDFVEGVRAVLVDKDQKPKWQPATIEEVNHRDVEKLFAPLKDEGPELAV